MVYRRCKRCFGPLEEPKDFDSECEKCKEKVMTDNYLENITESDELIDKAYPWAKTEEEQRRMFIFELMANPDIETSLLIKKMQQVYDWLVDGTAPRFKIVGK